MRVVKPLKCWLKGLRVTKVSKYYMLIDSSIVWCLTPFFNIISVISRRPVNTSILYPTGPRICQGCETSKLLGKGLLKSY